MKDQNGIVILKEFDEKNEQNYCWITLMCGNSAQEMIDEVLEDYPPEGQIVDIGVFDIREKFYNSGWVVKCDSREVDYNALARIVRNSYYRITAELQEEINRQYNVAAAEYEKELRRLGEKNND